MLLVPVDRESVYPYSPPIVGVQWGGMVRAAGTARKETDLAAHARDGGDVMCASDVKWREKDGEASDARSTSEAERAQ